jgi:hypothetical protein
VRGRGEATIDETIRAWLPPIVVEPAPPGPAGDREPSFLPDPGPAAPARPRGRSTIAFDRRTGRLEVGGLEVAGALGELALEGAVSRDRGGKLRLAIAWPGAPPLLLRRQGRKED